MSLAKYTFNKEYFYLIHFASILYILCCFFQTNDTHDLSWDFLRNFIPFVQFKKREKHPRRSVTFTKVTYILKGH